MTLLIQTNVSTIEIPGQAVVSLPTRASSEYAAHDVIEGKPHKQFVAEASEDATLGLRLHFDYCNPREIIDALQSLRLARTVFGLGTSSGFIYGVYVIAGVSVAPAWTLDDGTLLLATVDVTLEDPGPADTFTLEVPTDPPGLIDGNGTGVVIELDESDEEIIELDDLPPDEVPLSYITRS